MNQVVASAVEMRLLVKVLGQGQMDASYNYYLGT